MKLMMMRVTALALALGAGPALAHHSNAMFDATKTIELQGTVKELQWTNPHSWLQVMAPGPDGKAVVEWALEMGSPIGIARNGWRPKTVLPGDKVTVKMHPLKDGAAGGQLISVKLPSGKVMGEDYRPE
jgi:hypothetical protein